MGTSVIYSSLSHPSLTISHLKTINLYYWQYKLVVPCNFKLQSTIMLQILWNLLQQEWRYPKNKLKNIRRTNQHWQTYSNTCTTLCWNLSKILCNISLKKGCHWQNKLKTFYFITGAGFSFDFKLLSRNPRTSSACNGILYSNAHWWIVG